MTRSAKSTTILLLVLLLSGCVLERTTERAGPEAPAAPTAAVVEEALPVAGVASGGMGLAEAMARTARNQAGGRAALLEERAARIGSGTAQELARQVREGGYGSGAALGWPGGPQESERLAETWNVLDGSLLAASGRVAAGRPVGPAERLADFRRKSALLVGEEARVAYWRSVAAQPLLTEVEELLEVAAEMAPGEAKGGGKVAAQGEDGGALMRRLWGLRKELRQAQEALAQLTGSRTPPLALAAGGIIPGALHPPPPEVTAAALEQIALRARPEMGRVERIVAVEELRELLALLPGSDGTVAELLEARCALARQWADAGQRVAWGLFQGSGGKESPPTASRRLAFGVAVVGHLRAAEAGQRLVKAYYDQVAGFDKPDGRGEGKARTLEWARQRSGNLSMRWQAGLVYAAWQGWLGRLYLSLGLGVMPAEFEGTPLAQLAEAIARHQEQLAERLITAQRGDNSRLDFATSLPPGASAPVPAPPAGTAPAAGMAPPPAAGRQLPPSSPAAAPAASMRPEPVGLAPVAVGGVEIVTGSDLGGQRPAAPVADQAAPGYAAESVETQSSPYGGQRDWNFLKLLGQSATPAPAPAPAPAPPREGRPAAEPPPVEAGPAPPLPVAPAAPVAPGGTLDFTKPADTESRPATGGGGVLDFVTPPQ